MVVAAFFRFMLHGHCAAAPLKNFARSIAMKAIQAPRHVSRRTRKKFRVLTRSPSSSAAKSPTSYHVTVSDQKASQCPLEACSRETPTANPRTNQNGPLRQRLSLLCPRSICTPPIIRTQETSQHLLFQEKVQRRQSLHRRHIARILQSKK